MVRNAIKNVPKDENLLKSKAVNCAQKDTDDTVFEA